MESKFELGNVYNTKGIYNMSEENPHFALYVYNSLTRHANCDWGELDDEDKELNNDALANGGRLFSSYENNNMPKIWIITEWDRSTTTILFPSEY